MSAESAHRFGYVRVSTKKQDGSEQWKALEAAGVPRENIAEDHGVTGRTLTREALESLTGVWSEKQERFTHGRMRAGDVLVVTKLDRLGRNTSEMLQFAERLNKSGMHLHILNMKIDTSDESGKLLFTVMAGIATMEAGIKAERARDGIARRRARGEVVGGRTPKRSREQVEQQAKLVRNGTLSATKAAEELGISRSTFYARCEAEGISLRR